VFVLVLFSQCMKLLSELTHVIYGYMLVLELVGLSVFENWACLSPPVAIPLHIQWWWSSGAV
jgi:hypothetical protein